MKTVATLLAVASVALLSGTVAQAQTHDGRTPAEQRNLDLVKSFWESVWLPRDASRIPEFMAPDYVEHNPNVAGGLDGLVKFMTRMSNRTPPAGQAARAAPPRSDVVEWLVDGDLVTLIRERSVPEPTDRTKSYKAYGFDSFRLRDGKIVEHWDAATKPTGAPPAAGAAAGGAPPAPSSSSR